MYTQIQEVDSNISPLDCVSHVLFILFFKKQTYGLVIHEFDPWFNFRATQYLADKGSANKTSPSASTWKPSSPLPLLFPFSPFSPLSHPSPLPFRLSLSLSLSLSLFVIIIIIMMMMIIVVVAFTDHSCCVSLNDWWACFVLGCMNFSIGTTTCPGILWAGQ